jgi:hypothetical protein
MKKKPSRRDFLKIFAAAIGAGVIGSSHWVRQALLGSAQDLENKLFIPFLKRAEIGVPSPTLSPTPKPTETSQPPPPPETDGRVVHVHCQDATFWNNSDRYYWNYVDQDVVNDMVDQGLMSLTEASSVADAWLKLIPDYEVGKKIAIKVNLNHVWSCDSTPWNVNALIHPINSMVRGLKMAGVSEGDIWVYDAIRWIPDYFVNGCQYNDIQYFGHCRNPPGWNYDDPDTVITFSPPPDVPGIDPVNLPYLLLNSTYLINIPIMRIHHSGNLVTLSFKNHLGSVNFPGNVHGYLAPGGSNFSLDYNPLVDIYLNSNIKDKTILTIGDALFGGQYPAYWNSFGGQPNSLFLSTDPVAVDSVMCDFLSAEGPIPPQSDYYLPLAHNAGLGLFERGDPWGDGYNLIDYQRITL